MAPISLSLAYRSWALSRCSLRSLSLKHFILRSCLWIEVTTVGCIYASYPQYKSNILQNLFKSFKLLSKSSKYSKIFFLIFLYFYSHLFECPIIFFALPVAQRFVFASVSRFDSESRSAYRLVGSTRQVGCPPT